MVASDAKAQAIGAAILVRLARQAQANRVQSLRLRAAIWAVLDASGGKRLSASQVRERLVGVPRPTLRTIQRHIRRDRSSVCRGEV
jgi:hypothetical protein